MATLWSELELGILAMLIFMGILAFAISTISGGGGALLLVPVLNWSIGVQNTAPVLNLGTFIGRPSRLLLFWKHIHWKLCAYYAPAAVVGAWAGGYLFAQTRIEWLQVFVGLFLVSTLFQFRFGARERSFPMKLPYFIPLGLLVATLSTLIGALGPVLNPFYLNYGLDKEALVATKTANSFIMGLSQLGTYAFFGLLQDEYWIYGLALGIGATVGNILGKKLLARMRSTTFRKFLVGFMVFSGLLMLLRYFA